MARRSTSDAELEAERVRQRADERTAERAELMRQQAVERRARCPTDPPGNCAGNAVYDCDWCWDLYVEEGCRLRDQQQARDEVVRGSEDPADPRAAKTL